MLNDNENPKFASRYQIASGLCGPLIYVAMRLCSSAGMYSTANSVIDMPMKKVSQKVTNTQTGCNKSVHKLLKSCVRTASSKLLEQVWNKLLIICNEL